jgi:conjugal transfer/type IV secretion protein DotA/TraY
MKLRILSWIVLSFAYTAAFASSSDVDFASIFVAPATDMSLYYLGVLFGSVSDVLVGGSNVVVGQMFYVFNTGIITFTALLIFYTLTLSVVNTAQDGNAMGQKVSTWIVLRIVTGMSLLVPSYSGYSAIQILVMWSVVQGVGFADTIWTQALNTVEAYGGSVVIPVNQGLTSGDSSSDTNNQYQDQNAIASNNSATYSPIQSVSNGSVTLSSSVTASTIYLASMCAQYQYKDCQQNPPTTGSCVQGDYGYYSMTSGTDNQSLWCFGKLGVSGDTSTCDGSCGYFQSYMNTSNCTQGCAYYEQAFNNLVLAVAPLAIDFYNNAVSTCESDSSGKCDNNDDTAATLVDYSAAQNGCATNEYNTQYVCSPSQSIISGASTYYTVSMADRQQGSYSSAGTSWYDSASSAGWAMAGSYYRDLVGGGQVSSVSLKTIQLPQFAFGKIPNNTLVLPTTLSYQYQKVYYDLVNTAVTGSSTSSNGTKTYVPMQWYSNAAYYYLNEMQGVLTTNGSSGSSSETPQQAAYDQFTALMLTQLVQLGNPFTTLGSGYSYVFPEESYGDFTKYPGYVWNLLSDNMAALAGIQLYPDTVTSSGGLWGTGFFSVPTISNICKGLQGCKSSDAPDYAGCFTSAINSGCITNSSSAVPYSGILGQASASAQAVLSDPLLSIASVGQYFLQNSMDYWTNVTSQIFNDGKDLAGAYMGVQSAVSIAASAAAFTTSLAMTFDVGGAFGLMAGAINAMFQFFFQLDKAMMEAWLPFGTAVALMFFTLGIMMGVYLPFVPFLLYLFGVIAWLIAVVEAMVAAPLVAMGVTHPEGHDLLGKSEQAVMLLLGVFIRPAAMVIGLLMAITLNYIMIGFFNYGFVVTVNPILASLSTDATDFQLLIVAATLIVYVYVIIEVMNMSFSMIFQVPDKVLRWIGGPVEQSGAAAAMGQIKGGVSQSAQSAGQGASQKAGQGSSVQGQAPQASTDFKGKKGPSGGGGKAS